jgi:triphosphoribosyl-dephospho-CoA synthase
MTGRIRAAFVGACRDELDAPKPGNVHVFADGHCMTAGDFLRSAEAAADPLTAFGVRVGARILAAVEATRAAVNTNTNLGIILICAPLAAAAERATGDLRASVAEVIADLDVTDADCTFRAITLASPAGLGSTERHDVHAPATVTLADAMGVAAKRDRIAAQFSSNFIDIFELGLPSFRAAVLRRRERSYATLAVYLAFLAAFPDTHIMRKYGAAAADEVRRTAIEFTQRLQTTDDPRDLLDDLLAWDRALKAGGINPGTSADLTVATMFALRLQDIPDPGHSGHLAVRAQQ